MTLPAFRFHPDPLRSGSVVPSDATCACCGEARGFVYAGPVYAADEELDDALCPWCIADGSAHEQLGAEFVDSEAFDDDAPEGSVETIITRTPGYSAWQGERWPSCCGDAAAFLEPVGAAEIRERYPKLDGTLITYIVHELGISGGAAHRLAASLDRDRGPTAFVFQCLTCETHLVHVDQK